MTTKEFVALERKLLPDLPDFEVKGTLLFIKPIGSVLRGFCFEGSSFSKESFYINVFFLPMYIPMDDLGFTFVDRLRSAESGGWESTHPNLDSDLRAAVHDRVPYLRSLCTPIDIVKAIRPKTKLPNPHVHEAFAYSLIKAGDYQSAVDVIKGIPPMVDSAVDWQRALQERVLLIQEKLQRSPEEALQQLDAWEVESFRNLKLEAYR